MPIYTIFDKESEENFDVMMSWDELQALLGENQNWSLCLSTPKISNQSNPLGNKLPEGFKDNLREIRKAYGNSKNTPGLDVAL
jgi:hypothetical protein